MSVTEAQLKKIVLSFPLAAEGGVLWQAII